MWAMSKRVFLFLLVNILIITTLSIVWAVATSVFGLPTDGYGMLLTFSVVFGFGGAFISLFISKWMAKKMMGVQIIDPRTNDPTMRHIVDRVHEYSRAAGLTTMPEVGFYNKPEVNAFATGPSRSNSLVAVSAGLLRSMNRDQVDGVLAHEVAHIANGDMVTMTLLQGIINAIVLFLSRILASLAASAISRSDRPSPFIHLAFVIVFQICLSILGSIVVNYYSRKREFRADYGGARYAGRDKMISALEALRNTTGMIDTEQEALASLKISGKPKSALQMLFATHPPLEDRIAALKHARI